MSVLNVHLANHYLFIPASLLKTDASPIQKVPWLSVCGLPAPHPFSFAERPDPTSTDDQPPIYVRKQRIFL